MSLINKMLRDLDRRHASQGGMEATAPGRLAEQVRPVSGWGVSPDFFWRAAAVLLLLALGGVGWLIWQWTHRPAEPALQDSFAGEKASRPKIEAPAPLAVAAAPPPAAAEPAATPPPESVKVETPKPAPAARTPTRERIARPSRPRPEPKRAGSVPSAAPVPTAAPAESGKIDLRPNTNPRDRAENEFRRAVNLMNRGRVAEGMDGLRGALEIDPGHEAARQTLVAFSLEARRVDEAAALLERGLALNAQNSGFAMLLARISVERGDISGALSLLQKHAPPRDRNPDFHAFAAALYQRLERQEEAVEHYRTALALAPAAGVWWVGLGISYQALQRPKVALEAFARARATGNLGPELSAFVEQRLKQLQ